MRWHINNEGKAGRCKAAQGKCPFGSEEDHYATAGEARQAYEAKHSEVTLPKPASFVEGDELSQARHYSKVPLGTVVRTPGGMLFLKTEANLWETSEDGGMGFENREMVKQFPKATIDTLGLTKEQLVDLHEPRTVALTSSLLVNASFEEGYAARAYLRLLNHQNYEQAKKLYGQVKDQEVIDVVKEAHVAKQQVATTAEKLEKTRGRLKAASTNEQKLGYMNHVRMLEQNLLHAKAEAVDAEKKVDELKAKYAKKLAIHNNSLKALETRAKAGGVIKPHGLRERISKLEQEAKRPSVKELNDALKRGASFTEVATLYGKDDFITSAKKYDNALSKKQKLEEELNDALREALSTNSKEKLELANSKIAARTEAIRNLAPTLEAEEKRIALMKDELRDRGLQERAVQRELAALKKIAS